MSYFLHSLSFIVPILLHSISRQFRRSNICFLSALRFRRTMVCLHSLGNFQGSYCYSNNRIDASNFPFCSFSPVWPDSRSYSLQTRIPQPISFFLLKCSFFQEQKQNILLCIGLPCLFLLLLMFPYLLLLKYCFQFKFNSFIQAIFPFSFLMRC